MTHVGGLSLTRFHSGCDTNLTNPYKSGSCSILAREHGGFGDVLDALAGRGMPAAEDDGAVVLGHVFAGDLFGAFAPHPVAGAWGRPCGRSTTLRVIVAFAWPNTIFMRVPSV
jgi:hypothetical protein